MGEKSHVSREAKVCPVCGTKHNHDCGILLDKRLHNSLERETVTGWGMCEEHDKLFKQGYVAIVEIDRAKSDGDRPDQVWRLGRIIHMKRAAFDGTFDQKAPASGLVWGDPDLLTLLENKFKELEKDGEG